MQTILQQVEQLFQAITAMDNRVLTTIIIIALLWISHLVTAQLIHRQVEDVKHHYRWYKTASYVIVLLGIFLVGRVWLAGIDSLATYLGLVSAGLAISLQKPLTSFAAWFYIVSQRPFEVGDRIQLGEHAGDVIDIGMFKFTMLEIGNWVYADQSTGRIMYVPNGEIFSKPLANYTTGLDYIWHEIRVMLTFESNWEKAKAILEEIVNDKAPDVSQTARERLKAASRRFMIWYQNLTPIVYLRVEEYGVLLTMRYLCPPRRRRSTNEAIWIAVLKAFQAEPDIEFAYPTQRFYHRADERAEIPVPVATEANFDNGA